MLQKILPSGPGVSHHAWPISTRCTSTPRLASARKAATEPPYPVHDHQGRHVRRPTDRAAARRRGSAREGGGAEQGAGGGQEAAA
ncbi:hypothetical protein GCM10020220_045610 [Nonomuraea rubra]